MDFTIDLFTGIGSVILIHEDDKVLERDIDFIRYMEEFNGLFQYETKIGTSQTSSCRKYTSLPLEKMTRCNIPFRPMDLNWCDTCPMIDRNYAGSLMRRMTTVDASKEIAVLVDPYSTGCLIAEEIAKRGYKVIALWTKGFSEDMKTHVPLSCENLNYFAEVQDEGNLGDTVKAIYKAAGKYRVVTVIAGGEAGVDMADALSERMNVRTNGTDIPNRRDKKLQQELIKKAGLRSVRQAGGDKFSDVEHFLKTEEYPVVLKPVESAG